MLLRGERRIRRRSGLCWFGLAVLLLVSGFGCQSTSHQSAASPVVCHSDSCSADSCSIPLHSGHSLGSRYAVCGTPNCDSTPGAFCAVPDMKGFRGSAKPDPPDRELIQQVSMTSDVPRELRKATLPVYIIEPPDILLIDAVSHLRPADAPVQAGEPLLIQVNRTIPWGQQEDPVAIQFKQLNGIFVIAADGYLDLGPEYGKVHVAGQPLAEIQRRVEQQLLYTLTSPQVRVTLADPDAKQYVAGQHLVRMDGTVGLGIYGSVYVTGLTLEQAKHRIEQHLSQFIARPEVAVDVLAYNSKVYYVVTDGGGAGEQVFKLPSTGNETVLDAIANISGLPTVASKSDIWVARPSRDVCGPDQVLPVDWNAIVQGAQTATNYQVLPGDRIYVKADKMIIFDTAMAKITAPFERLLGFTILGNATVRTLQQGRGAFGNNGGGF